MTFFTVTANTLKRQPSLLILSYTFSHRSETKDIIYILIKSHLFAEGRNRNFSLWRKFPKLWCRSWTVGNRVLLGDAAHTAHFSIGSGTRLAMEDAIALARAINAHDQLSDALQAYEAERIPVAEKIVSAANTSATWYDGFADKMALAPLDFAFDYITRSGRVDLDRLRQLSPNFMRAYEGRSERSDP